MLPVVILDTGKIKSVESYSTYGVEAAMINGPFSLFGEYIRSDISRDGNESLAFDGWYLGGSWLLTGESRNYRSRKGAFGGVEPGNSYGAWELAARVSELNLNDGGVDGGRERNFTLGLNWYPNPRVRLMANYIMVDNDEEADADGDAGGDDDPGIFQARVQTTF